jgi:hypothetical protein
MKSLARLYSSLVSSVPYPDSISPAPCSVGGRQDRRVIDSRLGLLASPPVASALVLCLGASETSDGMEAPPDLAGSREPAVRSSFPTALAKRVLHSSLRRNCSKAPLLALLSALELHCIAAITDGANRSSPGARQTSVSRRNADLCAITPTACATKHVQDL